DLVALVYACWRVGAVVVVADAGLGRRGMTAALRSAAPRYLVGIPRALAAAKTLRWPGRRIAVGRVSRAGLRALGAYTTLAQVARRGRDGTMPAPPGPDDEAA